MVSSVFKHLEPEANDGLREQYTWSSIAISLKRIADSLEALRPVSMPSFSDGGIVTNTDDSIPGYLKDRCPRIGEKVQVVAKGHNRYGQWGRVVSEHAGELEPSYIVHMGDARDIILVQRFQIAWDHGH